MAKYDDYENGTLDGFNEGYAKGREDAIIEQAEAAKKIEHEKRLSKLQGRVTNLEFELAAINTRLAGAWFW